MKRLLKYLLGLLLVLLLGFTILLNLSAPLQWLARQLPAWTGNAVTVASAAGSLASVITLHDVRIRLGDDHIDIATIEVEAEPHRLLLGEILLPRVRLIDASYHLAARQDEVDREATIDIAGLLQKLALPVTLNMPWVRIDDVLLCQQAQCERQIENMKFGLLWDDGRIAFSDIDGAGEAAAARGSAAIGLAAPFPVDIELALASTWRQPGLQAELAARGALAALQVELQLSSQGDTGTSIHVDGELARLLDQPQVDAGIDIRQLDSKTITNWTGIELPEARLAAAGRLSYRQQALAFRGDVDAALSPLDRIQGRLALDWQDGMLTLASDQLEVLPVSSKLSIEASVDIGKTAGGLHWQATVRATDMLWPGLEPLALRNIEAQLEGDSKSLETTASFDAFDGGGQRATLQGGLLFDTLAFDADIDAGELHRDELQLGDLVLNAKGTPDNYQLSARGKASHADLPTPARFELSGRGDRESVRVNVDQLLAMQGSTRGSLQLDWRKALRLEGQLKSRQLRLESLFAHGEPRLTGSIDLESRFQVDTGGRGRIALQDIRLSGSINGSPLSGNGDLALEQDVLAVKAFALQLGEAELQLKGDTQHVLFELDIPELARLDNRAAGQLAATGRIGKRLNQPTLQLAANATAVRWQDWRLAAANIELDLPAGFDADATQHIRLDDLRDGTMPSIDLAIDVRGSRARHDIDVGLTTVDGKVQAMLQGGLREDIAPWDDNAASWQGKLQSLRATVSGTDDDWQLEAPANITLAPPAGELAGFCLERADSRICTQGIQVDRELLSLGFDIERLALADLAAFMPTGFRASGKVTGHLDYRQVGDRRSGGLSLRVGAGRFADERLARPTDGNDSDAGMPASDDDGMLVEWQGATLDASLRDRVFRLTGEARLDADSQADAELRIDLPANGRSERARLTGKASLALRDLSLLPAFFPDVRAVEGLLESELAISGTLGQPRLNGRLSFVDGHAELTPLGTRWDDINIRLDVNDSALQGKGSLRSGDGELRFAIDGQDFLEQASATLAVEGENFLAVNSPEVELIISPRMDLALADRHVDILGTIDVVSARLQPRDFSSGTSVSDDQVIVNRDDADGSGRYTYNAEVKTRLGNDTRFSGYGLDTRLTGELTVQAATDQPATASGTIDMAAGKYRIYGQTLDVQRGRLVYTGQPISEPGLDVRAVRQVNPNQLVGMNLRGTASAPKLDFFAEPALPQTEILSYLVSGSSVGENQAAGGNVDSASVALGLGAGQVLADAGDKVGIDEVRFSEVSDREQAALILGKYLSPDLYVGYGIGLFDAVNSFRINYRLSSKWTLEAISGIKSSTDLIYTIER
ncbi:MAG: translocation/assembly module TamB domain-containing protein [Gammaproteobacteria bacterium]|nr:translocation/assembly module TamB domain-containing protein [Gammaproteobacteria bacterium]